MIDGDKTRLRTPSSALNEGWKVTDGSGVAPDRWGAIENPFRRINAFINSNYQFDAFDLAFDVTYSKTDSQDTIDPAFKSAWFPKGNLTGLFDVPASALNVIPDGEWIELHYTFFEAGGRKHENEREYLSANLSLSGVFLNDWTWDVNLSSGKSTAELKNYNALRNDRINSKFQAVGECIDADNCPSFNPFTRPSREFTDYILDNHTTNTDIKTHGFSANVAGGIYELPAGEIQLSTGLEIRQESIDYQPSALWQSGNLSSMMTAMDAERTIREVYAEVLIPVVSDLPLVQMLEIEGAIRQADYSTESASFTSSKLGVNWTINDSVRFRSTFSKAVRAPQLTEMFAGESIGYVDMTDPCDQNHIDGGPKDGRRKANCEALGINEGWTSNLTGTRGRSISSGFEELKEEKADTLTVGFVFQPTYVEELRVSLDYYDIKLTDMIKSFSANGMLSNCVDLAPGSINNDFCKQVTRENNGDVSLVRVSNLNADESRRTGLDIEADYRLDNWTFKLIANHQFEVSTTEYDFVEGRSIKDDTTGELDAQKWQANFVTTYAMDDFSASWTTKFKQGGKRWLDRADERYDNQEVEDSIKHNIRAGYNITDEANVYVGVNNITDENGTDHWLTSWGTRNAWDIMGRSYYVGFTYDF
ncbi:MAG: iron complex outermembrane receptor protein [Alteromonadaceae bacterium]